MRLKRIVALILSFLIVFNVQAPMLAETEVNEDGPQLHTVSWTMDPEYSLEELTPEKTTMMDEGQIFTNSEGPARTEIQSVYHVDQTLVTVSLAGTSFSFAPIMNDNYFLESGIGDADSSGIKDSEKDIEPEVEEEKKPEGTVAPEQPETTKPVTTTVPQGTPVPDETPEEEPTEVPVEDTTEKPTEKPTEEQTVPQDKEDPDNTPIPAEEPDEQGTLHTGYGKTIAQTNLYNHVNGAEATGKLPINVVVYISSLPSQQWAQIVFDSPDGIVDGYVRTKNIVNLEPEEEQRVASEVKTTTDYREWKEHPLPRTNNYILNVRETEQPKETEAPDTNEAEKPETTITPEEDKKADPTDTPVPEPTDTSVPDPTDTPVPEPTDTPIPDLTDSPVPDLTDTPVPETTDTPIPDPTDIPVPETTDTSVPDSTDTPIPDPTDIPVSDLADVSAQDLMDTPNPDPAERPQDQDEPAEANEESDNTIGTSLMRWLFPAALAEEELPEENRIRPSAITGQKIGGTRAPKMKMLRSAAPASTGFNAAVYPGLFDIATDVRLSVSTTGVKEDILVSQYTGNHVYSYKLNTEGLTATLSGKAVNLSDEDGNCLAQIEAPNMTDASGNYSTDIEVTLEANGDSYILTYEPNDKWMKSAGGRGTVLCLLFVD